MKWKNSDPYGDGDHLTTRGLLWVGGGVLFAHFLFPFIWWNFLGGSTYSEQPSFNDIPSHYRVVTYTPFPTVTPIVTPTLEQPYTQTVIRKQQQEQTPIPEQQQEQTPILDEDSTQQHVFDKSIE